MNDEILLGRDKIAESLFEDIMQSIDKSTIVWKLQSDLRAIDTFYANCPTCDGFKAIKTNSIAAYDKECKTASHSAKCTFCDLHFKVFVIEPLIDEDRNKDPTCESVWAYPTGNNSRKLIFDKDIIDDIWIFNSYETAIDCFNKKSWYAVLLSCGVTLEGICKKHFPTAKNKDDLGDLFRNLGNLLEKDPQYLPLLEPMKKLGDALNLGRHKGAHFDLKKTPDRQSAVMVLDATEFLMKYFYMLTKDAESLKKHILALKPRYLEFETPETSDVSDS